MICIHSRDGKCMMHCHTCNGKSDTRGCPEWRTIQALHRLSIAIRGMISLQPGGELIIQGMNW